MKCNSTFGNVKTYPPNMPQEHAEVHVRCEYLQTVKYRNPQDFKASIEK